MLCWTIHGKLTQNPWTTDPYFLAPGLTPVRGGGKGPRQPPSKCPLFYFPKFVPSPPSPSGLLSPPGAGVHGDPITDPPGPPDPPRPSGRPLSPVFQLRLELRLTVIWRPPADGAPPQPPPLNGGGGGSDNPPSMPMGAFVSCYADKGSHLFPAHLISLVPHALPPSGMKRVSARAGPILSMHF